MLGSVSSSKGAAWETAGSSISNSNQTQPPLKQQPGYPTAKLKPLDTGDVLTPLSELPHTEEARLQQRSKTALQHPAKFVHTGKRLYTNYIEVDSARPGYNSARLGDNNDGPPSSAAPQAKKKLTLLRRVKQALTPVYVKTDRQGRYGPSQGTPFTAQKGRVASKQPNSLTDLHAYSPAVTPDTDRIKKNLLASLGIQLDRYGNLPHSGKTGLVKLSKVLNEMYGSKQQPGLLQKYACAPDQSSGSLLHRLKQWGQQMHQGAHKLNMQGWALAGRDEIRLVWSYLNRLDDANRQQELKTAFAHHLQQIKGCPTGREEAILSFFRAPGIDDRIFNWSERYPDANTLIDDAQAVLQDSKQARDVLPALSSLLGSLQKQDPSLSDEQGKTLLRTLVVDGKPVDGVRSHLRIAPEAFDALYAAMDQYLMSGKLPAPNHSARPIDLTA